jgi:acetyltransferase-like isoleucine patch superfamily enzyme
MFRLLSYFWFTLVMCTTAVLSDVTIMLRFRGWLVRPCFRSCGRRFEIASGARINYSNRMTIGDDVYIGPGCWINAYGGITIEDEVLLGPYTVLVTTEHARVNNSYRFARVQPLPIHIGRGSWTSAHTVITKGVRVGRGVLVAAGAVVTKDLPDDCVAGGVPARVLRIHEDATDPRATTSPVPDPTTTA